MDKVTAIKIKHADNTYSEKIPFTVLAENVEWNENKNLIDILGTVDLSKSIQDQITQLYNNKISLSEINNYVNDQLNNKVTSWLDQNVTPTGSAVLVDKSLSIEGAAGDAKATKDALAVLKKNLNTSLNTISITSSGKTNIYLDIGQQLDIYVKTNNNNVNCFTEGYTATSYVLLLAANDVGKHTVYTAQHAGFICFNSLSAENNFEFIINIKSQLNDETKSQTADVHATKAAVFKKVKQELELGTITTNTGQNYANQNCMRSPTYINKLSTIVTFQNCKARLFAYEMNGTFVGGYSASEGYTKDWAKYTKLKSPVYLNEFIDKKYQIRLDFSDFDGDISSDNANVVLDVAIEDIADETREQLYIEMPMVLELASLDTTSGEPVSSTVSMRSSFIMPNSVRKITFQNCNARLFAYKTDGTFVGGYSASEGYTKDWTKYTKLVSPVYPSDFIDDKYMYRVLFGNFVGDVSIETANAKMQIQRTNTHEAYSVGVDGNFKTFTEMLIALKDNVTPKTVYVHSGTYNIFEEIGGAEYMQTVDTSASWSTLNYIVPPNTEIVGVGDVVLAWNPTDEQIIDQAHAFIFAPLNLMGSCKIKNIKIHCSNCRYGIHDETGGRLINNSVIHEFENVEVIYTQSTYGVKYAYGAGHNRNCKYKFKNCLFSAAYGAVWSTHDWPAGATENSVFEFDNCVFWNNLQNKEGNIRLSSSDTVGRLDDVKINACVFNSISFSTEGSADIKQGYKVTTMLCKPYTPTWASHILEADRISPIDYLILT